VGQYPPSFERHRDELAVTYPDDVEEIGLIHTALIKIGEVIRASTPVNGQGAVWKRLTAQAASERAVLCKHLDGKQTLTAMRRLYAATSREMAETTVEQRQVQAESLAALESSLPDGASGRTGRLPPIILTSAANFIQLHKQLKTVAKRASSSAPHTTELE
jgi:hypothetical protein